MSTTTKSPPGTVLHDGTARRYRKWWHIFLEAAILLVIATLGLELFLHICGVGGAEFLEPDSVLGCRHIPAKKVIWRLEGYSADTLNKAGCRDVEHSLSKPSSTVRIALLGDSSTEGLQVPLSCTYARQLERLLNEKVLSEKTLERRYQHFEVLNFACSSYSTGQELLQFKREILAYKPDITVLLYNRGDNLENVRDCFKDSLKSEPRPYFFLDSQGYLQQDNAALKAHANIFCRNPFLNFLRRHSFIYGVFSQANLALSINESLYRKIRSWVLSLFNPHQGPKLPDKLRQLPLATYPPQSNTWQVTKRLIASLHQECTAGKSSFVLLTFPNLVNDPEFGQQIKDLAQLSRQERFTFLDLTPLFKAHPDPNALFLKYHFSKAGHEQVAQSLVRICLKDCLDLTVPVPKN